MFLDGDVSEMNKHVVQLIDVSAVLHRAETTESKLVSKKYNKLDVNFT